MLAVLGDFLPGYTPFTTVCKWDLLHMNKFKEVWRLGLDLLPFNNKTGGGICVCVWGGGVGVGGVSGVVVHVCV